MPERNVTEGVRHLLKMACVTVPAQVQYIMDGLVPIFQQARDEVADMDLSHARRLLSEAVARAEPECPTCEGHGFTGPVYGQMACPDCNGDGVQQPQAPPDGPLTKVCPKCGGGGNTAPWDEDAALNCDRCGGSGEVPMAQAFISGKDDVTAASQPCPLTPMVRKALDEAVLVAQGHGWNVVDTLVLMVAMLQLKVSGTAEMFLTGLIGGPEVERILRAAKVYLRNKGEDGGDREADDPATVDCNRCGGTGVFRTPSMRATCEKCKGSGQVPA